MVGCRFWVGLSQLFECSNVKVYELDKTLGAFVLGLHVQRAMRALHNCEDRRNHDGKHLDLHHRCLILLLPRLAGRIEFDHELCHGECDHIHVRVGV